MILILMDNKETEYKQVNNDNNETIKLKYK